MRPTSALIAVALAMVAIGQASGASVGAQGLPRHNFAGLRGTVVAEETGSPIPGAHIIAWWGSAAPPPSAFFVNTARVAEARSREDGTFALGPWEATVPVPVGSEPPRLWVYAPGRHLDASIRYDSPGPGRVEVRLRMFDPRFGVRQSLLRKHAWALAMAWAPLYGQPSPTEVLAAMDEEWRNSPLDDQGSGTPSQMFEATVQVMRLAHEEAILKMKP